MIDALLGAAGLGDLGTHFPPDDERWRDADSLDLLRTVVGDAARPGGERRRDRDLRGAAARRRTAREMERNLGRGARRAGERQGDDQRGHGLDRPRRGDRLHRGAPCSTWRPPRRTTSRWRLDRLDAIPLDRSRARSSSARSGRCPTSRSTCRTLAEAGVIRPVRPDKLRAGRPRARAAGAPRRRPGSPARAITPSATRRWSIDEAGHAHLRRGAPALERARPGARRARASGAGDGVAIMARNHRGFVEATLAVSKLGANGALHEHGLRRARSSPTWSSARARRR